MAETVFNEGSIDGTDFRVESDDNTHMFFIDGGNNRVGIGTNSPGLQFVVNAADAKSDNAGNQEATDDRSYGLQIVAGSTANDAPLFIQDHDGSNDLLILRGNGHLGLNHTSPQYGLTIAQGSTDKQKIGWEDGSNNKRGAIFVNGSTDAMEFMTGTSDTLRMKIDADGDVSITERLTVGSWDNSDTHGHAYIDISSDANEGADSCLYFQAGTTVKGSIYYNHNTDENAQEMRFVVGDNAVNAMTILGNGHIGVGSTTPEAQITFNSQVYSTSSAQGIRCQNPDTTADAVLQHYENADYVDWWMGANTYVNTSGQVVRFNTSKKSVAINMAGSSGTLWMYTGGTGANPTNRIGVNEYGNLLVQNNDSGGTNAGYIRNATSATFADDAYSSITSGEAGAFLIFAYDYGSGNGAVFFCNYSETAVKVTGSSSWVNSDTDGSMCVFKSANSHTTTVKNRSGGSKGLGFLLVGVNPRSS
jgi:hypothetical protein